MQSVKQQQILGYFLEEAKEHLDTIEQGLVDLRSTMADSERVNELFRAAHSIKGGAAMLGFDSIQKTAHHFEDCFKVLKEHSVKVDQRVEDLFLTGFDTLKALIVELQSPFGLREETAQQAVLAAEPTFNELQTYLQLLISGKPMSAPKGMPASALPANAAVQLTTILKAMLQLFKQGDSQKSRQQLIGLCHRLIQVSPRETAWIAIIQVVQRAIAKTQHSYAAIAPVVIKDLKHSSDLLLAGRTAEIAASANLQKLVVPTPPSSSPSAPQTANRASAATKPQVSIPREPRAAARTLLEVFNKSELIEIAEFLMKAIQ
ncbi:Hpt domain-containing protein [Myxacorys almedinensis]|uniref:Histidine kinase n=1 Tax=Myxacorys almedinensis A TaxID=2690445 RepID=A0A8J7YYQ8_9CYAN|nr:histidine kinase [Myxacorys almedinensis A]